MINKNKKKKFVSMKIRRSQVASIYGVGSIYQFKDTKNRNSEYESLMLASIDEWFPNLDDVCMYKNNCTYQENLVRTSNLYVQTQKKTFV